MKTTFLRRGSAGWGRGWGQRGWWGERRGGGWKKAIPGVTGPLQRSESGGAPCGSALEPSRPPMKSSSIDPSQDPDMRLYPHTGPSTLSRSHLLGFESSCAHACEHAE